MPTIITYEKLDELLLAYMDAVDDPLDFEALADAEPTPAQHLELSRSAELWATSAEFELEEDALRVTLFASASSQASEGGDEERALALARQATAVAAELGDWMIPDVRIRLFECLVKVGLHDEAAGVEAGLRRDQPDDLESFIEMGEVLSFQRKEKLAERWYNMGIRFAESNELTDEFEFELLVVERAEVRERGGLTADEYDIMAKHFEEAWDEQESL